MRPRDVKKAAQIHAALAKFADSVHPLPGIASDARRTAFVEQIIESIRRVEYVLVLAHRDISAECAVPTSICFDPLKAAILNKRQGKIDEAFWLIFLSVHFGKHQRGGWRYVREVYGRLNDGEPWDWAHVTKDVEGFRTWLSGNLQELQRKDVPGGFGNHRKYESLRGDSQRGTGAVVESYVGWVISAKTHLGLFNDALDRADGDPEKGFDELYRSMRVVQQFGRTARFDYLTMVGKIGLANIEPGVAYIANSTGPIKGAKLLFGEGASTATLEACTAELGRYIGVGMQVMEDSLCNWQKSAEVFRPFRG